MTLPTLNATEPVGFLVHGLIDYVVDTHLSAAERLDDELEGLEDMLFDDRPTDREVQWRTYELRKSLVHMRRVSLPMQEAVLSLQRRDLGYIDAELQPYFQDVYDHVLRTTEWLDSLREMVATVFETHLNARSNRRRSSAVPTAITGFYGMNVPYPGFGQHIGFWTSSWPLPHCRACSTRPSSARAGCRVPLAGDGRHPMDHRGSAPQSQDVWSLLMSTT
jgi:magnesium transporter